MTCVDHDGNDVVLTVLEFGDRLEFLANDSKAKDRDAQTLRLLKTMRDYLNACDLDRGRMVIELGPCEWDPTVGAASSVAHGCPNKATLSLGSDGSWHVCGSCAALPRFRKYRVRVRLDRPRTDK
jgi:hypothetical protein